MFSLRKRNCLAALILLVILTMAACERGENPVGTSVRPSPDPFTSELSLAEALAELDALTTPEGVEPEVFALLRTELARQLREQTARKFASRPPQGDANRVTNLAVLDQGGGTFRLTWSYRNSGDYNQDGSVGISDVTPIAIHFGEEADSENEWIDGNNDHTIGISDVTPIAIAFGVQCAGYTIETSSSAEDGFTGVETVPFADGDGTGRLQFSREVSLAVGEWVRVTPFDGQGTPGERGEPAEAVEWSDEFTFDVEWSEETTYVDESALSLLIDADTDDHIYTFDAAGVAQAGLDLSPGRVMVLHGIALETIVDSYEDGGELIVEGEEAYLTDAVENGTIGWDYGVSFTPDKVPSMIIGGKEVRADGEGVIDYEFSVGDYTYHIVVELQDAFAALEFTISKDLGSGLGAKMVLEGNLERFRVKDLMEIEGRELKSFNHNYEKMQGQGSISLVVAGSMEDTMTLVDLPTPLLVVPFMVGPVPVTLTIEAKFLVEVIVPPIDGSSRVTVSFSYDSDLGFNYDGVSVHNTGRLGSHSFNDEVTETGGSTALGVNFGVAFPRVKLSAFWGKIVPWAHIQFVIGGTWDPIAPCQTADYEIRGVGDIDFTLFNLSDVVGNLTFFQQTEKLLRAGD